MLASLDEAVNLESTFSPEEIETGIREMKIAAELIFKKHGKHARSKANQAARDVCKQSSKDDEKLKEVLLSMVTVAVRDALTDFKIDQKTRTARLEGL